MRLQGESKDSRSTDIMAEIPKDSNYRHLVRIANTDLDGNKSPEAALRKIRGIDWMLSHALCLVTGVTNEKKIGYLDEAHVARLDEAIKNPAKFNIPTWLFNRRRDYETGEDKHIITADLQFTKENDIKRLKKIKSRRGIRHTMGLPLRGQRTRSNFRRNKRKAKGQLGVKKPGKAGK